MSQIVVAQTAATSSQAAPLADCPPAQQVELRYMNAANELLDHAVENESVRILANVLTWTLARMFLDYGPAAAGDILHRFGVHIGTLAERRSAQEEASKEKEAGRAPH